ncbi:DUF6522 family protein [uncultured Paracoccus sp.]|uniref:DUF6522 family protein n=1 Tax=uncultured Paracoccus sp. TaxID=189685 RepID=UPI002630E27D|nr:DUF6522 family protein [uncultured Paracoccus sp.]
MRLELIHDGFQIDAVDLGPLFGVPTEEVQSLMLEGRIASLCEAGQGEDQGRHRITFRYGDTRVRLTINDTGDVLLRTRTTVAPHLEATRDYGEGQSGETSRTDPSEAAMGNRSAALTRHIEERFHPRHRRRLVELQKLAEMVEDLHEGDEGVPAGIPGVLCRVAEVLDAHLRMTERVVFPAIRADAASGLGPLIDMLRGNHDRLNSDCLRISEITGDFVLPKAACTSWATFYARLDEFTADLQEHMRLENDVLFPQFESGGMAHG